MRWRLWAVGILFAPSFGSMAYAGPGPRDVDVVISVDWEGEDLTDQNLQAMADFRRDFPQIPLVQFLNAAYYTKPGADPQDTTSRIRSVLSPCDEIGLHIHGWQDLFESAFQAEGLSASRFKSGPAFWSDSSIALGGRFGHDVPIKEYSEEEIQAVVRFSRRTLQQNGFTKPITSFRAGGWMADDGVLRAIAREGFTIDSSAITPLFLQTRLNGSPLFVYVNQLWGDGGLHPTSDTTPPYTILPGLVEVPGALFADYVTDNYVHLIMEHLLTLSPNERPILHLSFHEETAVQFLGTLRFILKRMNADYAQNGRVQFHFRTLAPNTCRG